jgi:long-subunit acyl-CoA synthetase (AMP-forming)
MVSDGGGRSKKIIVTGGGENVFPIPIEEVIKVL